MDFKQYLVESDRTDHHNYSAVVARFTEEYAVLDHAVSGLETEIGEIRDILKKYLQYGKPIDFKHLREECGDLLWYVALLIRATGLDFEGILEINIEKLRARYPEKFEEYLALNRDLETENKILGKEQV